MRYRLLYLMLCIVFCAQISFAQTWTKMNPELFLKHHSSINGNNWTTVFVKGDVDAIKRKVAELGGKVNYATSHIAVVKIQIANLGKLAEAPSIERIEARTPHIQALEDSMRIKANVNQVFEGLPPLTQSYDGFGVVMGIIDTGIDFTHPDFKDSVTGLSRVIYLWDQNGSDSANTPSTYGYGREWTNADINAGLCTYNLNLSAHGTDVSGIAAGNGKASSNHKYRGVAPGANLIVVAYNFTNPVASGIQDAVNYIYSKASAMNAPCVINLSLGDYLGSHDGLDLQAQMMDELLMAPSKYGKSMVAASGNEGEQYIHLNYTLSPSDTNFTWFKFSGSSYDIELWADTVNFQQAFMDIGADLIGPQNISYSFVGKTKFRNAAYSFDQIQCDTLFDIHKNIIAYDTLLVLLQGATYDVYHHIVPAVNASQYNWRLQLTGSGKFDLWDMSMVSGGLPIAPDFPPIVNYKYPDTLQTICSSFQCLDDVVVVGNYDNKRTYLDFTGNVNEPYPSIEPGNIDNSSSIGPTRDGRIKPDITAPGAITISPIPLGISAIDQNLLPTFLESNPYYARSGGTSDASPVVAGVAALYLQQHPTATPSEVKKALLTCPIRDNFTGQQLPNSVWGYGKVDAFATLTACASSNGIAQLNETAPLISAFPNPSLSTVHFNYSIKNISANSKVELELYDVVGCTVKKWELDGNSGSINWDRGTLQSGCYFYSLRINRTLVATNKLILL